MDFIQELKENKEKSITKVVELIINGIEANFISRKITHDEWKKHIHYNRPRVSFAFGTANSNEIQSRNEIGISVLAHMSEIERLVNTKLGIKAIEYRVDRRNHYFKLII